MTSTLLQSFDLTSALADATINTPFIRHLSSATLPAENFDKWLYNDYIYVRAGIHFTAHLIDSIPRTVPEGINDVDYDANAMLTELKTRLAGGYNTLRDELGEFRKRAEARSIELPALRPVGPILKSVDENPETEIDSEILMEELKTIENVDERCVKHMQFMVNLKKEHWTTQLASLWLSEKVYCDAMWAVKDSAEFGKLEEGIAGFVGWWANDGFREYVGLLERDTGRTQEGEAWGKDRERTRQVLLQLLEGEKGFWGIAEDGLE
ncbi:hypothetical protein FPQ18DRAFT_405248 [Pyronema domesticum]|uniref:Similar to Uncharacterized protein C530.07c acc. no. O59743 n=1 Tax=Pyronema omphalodes (strain CBS 100304) TaxID=1076935 RepID=U4KZY2_PYROM|nr:hypothetical protein FPQ18DRAFT_405248 [Pyronema domesticum]CCX07330.1 Similar to Uncharacterized protein C530.07c; acc. no. O59743 [Pyronema omphalodes CBS 100304]